MLELYIMFTKTEMNAEEFAPSRRDLRVKTRKEHRKTTRRGFFPEWRGEEDEQLQQQRRIDDEEELLRNNNVVDANVPDFEYIARATTTESGKQKKRAKKGSSNEEQRRGVVDEIVARGNALLDVVGTSLDSNVEELRTNLRFSLDGLRDRLERHQTSLSDMHSLCQQLDRFEEHVESLQSQHRKLEDALRDQGRRVGSVEEKLARVEWVNGQLERLHASVPARDFGDDEEAIQSLSTVMKSAASRDDAVACLKRALLRLDRVIGAMGRK